MTLHGNVLTSDEAGELAAIQLHFDRLDHSLYEKDADDRRLGMLLQFHHRLAARVAELERELAQIPPTLEWLRSVLGEPDQSREHAWCSWDAAGVWWDIAERLCKTIEKGKVLATRAAVLAAMKEALK